MISFVCDRNSKYFKICKKMEKFRYFFGIYFAVLRTHVRDKWDHEHCCRLIPIIFNPQYLLKSVIDRSPTHQVGVGPDFFLNPVDVQNITNYFPCDFPCGKNRKPEERPRLFAEFSLSA